MLAGFWALQNLPALSQNIGEQHKCHHHTLICSVVRVNAGPRIAPTTEWWNKGVPDNMKEVNSVQGFVDELVCCTPKDNSPSEHKEG